MTKKQEQLYVCRKGHTLTEGIEFCRDEDCRHYKCDASKCPPEDSNCVFCIPYEPATCPDCGHPIAEHGIDGCLFVHEYSEGQAVSGCECERTPTDLQPEKHCTETQEEFEEAIASSLSHEEGMAELELLNKNCQPTPTMPLRELSLSPQKVEEIADEMVATCCGDNCIGTMPCDKCSAWMLFNKALRYGLEAQRDADMAWRQKKCEECLSKSVIEVANLEAHDSEVAKQAVKEFAEKVIATMPEADEKCMYDHVYAGQAEMRGMALAHIRAMAEE